MLIFVLIRLFFGAEGEDLVRAYLNMSAAAGRGRGRSVFGRSSTYAYDRPGLASAALAEEICEEVSIRLDFAGFRASLPVRSGRLQSNLHMVRFGPNLRVEGIAYTPAVRYPAGNPTMSVVEEFHRRVSHELAIVA